MKQKSYRETVKENAVKDLIGMGVVFGKDPQAASSTETELCFEAANTNNLILKIMIVNGRIYLELINAGDVKILVEKYPPRTYYTHYRRKDGETNEELFKRIMDHVYLL